MTPDDREETSTAAETISPHWDISNSIQSGTSGAADSSALHTGSSSTNSKTTSKISSVMETLGMAIP